MKLHKTHLVVISLNEDNLWLECPKVKEISFLVNF